MRGRRDTREAVMRGEGTRPRGTSGMTEREMVYGQEEVNGEPQKPRANKESAKRRSHFPFWVDCIKALLPGGGGGEAPPSVFLQLPLLLHPELDRILQWLPYVPFLP